MAEGNVAVAILLMLLLILAGFIIVFNWIPILGVGLGNITNFSTGFFIILVKLVGIGLIVLPIWVIYMMIRG